jgi:hypothetical protein
MSARMGTRRRRLAIAGATAAVAVVAVVVAVLFHQFFDGVARRRAQNVATIAAQARQHHDAEVHLCEVAINGDHANLRALIAALTTAAAQPKDAAEAQARADSQAIFARFLGPIDCEVFVKTGQLVAK